MILQFFGRWLRVTSEQMRQGPRVLDFTRGVVNMSLGKASVQKVHSLHILTCGPPLVQAILVRSLGCGSKTIALG